MTSFFDRVISEAVRTKYVTDAEHRVRAVIEYLPDVALVRVFRTTEAREENNWRVFHSDNARPLAQYETARNGAAQSARREMRQHWHREGARA